VSAGRPAAMATANQKQFDGFTFDYLLIFSKLFIFEEMN